MGNNTKQVVRCKIHFFLTSPTRNKVGFFVSGGYMSNEYKGFIAVIPNISNGTCKAVEVLSEELDIGARIETIAKISGVSGFKTPVLKNIDPSGEFVMPFDTDDCFWLFASHYESFNGGGTVFFRPSNQSTDYYGEDLYDNLKLSIFKAKHE